MAAEVIIYSTEHCYYCVKAKELLNQKNVAYTEIRVDLRPELRQEMMQKSGRHTVPQIFINGQSIGGNYELQVLESQGKLDQLLRG